MIIGFSTGSLARGDFRRGLNTMQEAETFLRCFGNRLRQIHLSFVNSRSGHERLNFDSLVAFRRIAHWLKDSIPVILETPVDTESIDEEVTAAESVFSEPENGGNRTVRHWVAGSK